MIFSSATTVAEARWLEEHGVDAVVAQGVEAGGHRGMFLTTKSTSQLGTLVLVPQVIPVIAVSGIVDVRGTAAAFALGASAVRMAPPTCFASSRAFLLTIVQPSDRRTSLPPSATC